MGNQTQGFPNETICAPRRSLKIGIEYLMTLLGRPIPALLVEASSAGRLPEGGVPGRARRAGLPPIDHAFASWDARLQKQKETVATLYGPTQGASGNHVAPLQSGNALCLFPLLAK